MLGSVGTRVCRVDLATWLAQNPRPAQSNGLKIQCYLCASIELSRNGINGCFAAFSSTAAALAWLSPGQLRQLGRLGQVEGDAGGGAPPILPTQWRVVQEQCGLCAPWRGLCTSRCGALCAGCAGLGAPRPAEAVRAPRELHRDTLAPCHGDPHRSHVHASVPLHCGLNPL